MDRREQRFKKRTAVTKEQALNFLCATMRLSKIVKPINAVRGTATGSRSPAGPRRLGAATRISASLLRRLSVFFESTPDQAPKAAKYAVLIPSPGMFVNVRNAPRVVIAALSGRPLFRRVSRCVRSCWQRRVCTHFHPQKRMWAVLQAIATRAFLPRGTH